MLLENNTERVMNLVDIIDDLNGINKVRLPIHILEENCFSTKYDESNTRTHNVRQFIFKTGIPYNILLTDITYLFYGNNKKCYLSTIKDAETNEILAYYIS